MSDTPWIIGSAVYDADENTARQPPVAGRLRICHEKIGVRARGQRAVVVSRRGELLGALARGLGVDPDRKTAGAHWNHGCPPTSRDRTVRS